MAWSWNAFLPVGITATTALTAALPGCIQEMQQGIQDYMKSDAKVASLHKHAKLLSKVRA